MAPTSVGAQRINMKLPSQKFGTFKFPEDYDVIRTATLNKTDLAGGNNKYYHIEAHTSKDKAKFRLYSRYGRVGHEGTEEERIPTQDELSLLAAFESLKSEKTGKSKGYVEVKMAATKVGSSVANVQILSDDIKKSNLKSSDPNAGVSAIKLHRSVEKLVERLYTEAGTAVRTALSGSLNTTVENPLGTLTLSQINTGRTILQEIQQMLTDKPKLKGSINKDLIDLSNQFYSAIPQQIAHRPKPSAGKKALDEWLGTMVLNDEKRLDEKEDLLGLLSDVQGMVGGFASSDIEKKYTEIGCEYEYLPDTDDRHKRIFKYMNESRSKHHDWKVSIQNIWTLSIKGQRQKHLDAMKGIGNVQPLFHGSGPQNILGICKHGLLMRPPGVYVTGSMFGNGLYFADQSSKSEQYAFGRYGGGSGKGESYFMFVADVALGKIKKYQNSQSSLTKAPPGYDSVQGEKGYSLVHNEFIIYDIKQHLLQYLIEFKTSSGYYR
jgi:poly [ADP-ribose] polymerase